MHRMKLHSLLLMLAVLTIGVHTTPADTTPNVILFIGDGMGPEQVRAARYHKGTNLVFEAWPHQGEVRTFSANNSITDSGAGATAMATGHKVNNGVISRAIPGDGTDLETVLEILKRQGRRTGLVTTTSVTHATPAAFAAHSDGRSNTAKIADDYLQRTRPDVLLGGGGDGMTVSAAAVAGYSVATNAAGLAAAVLAGGPVAGLFGSGNMPYEFEGLGTLPALDTMTVAALALLDDAPAGFFMMVEGGRIDHAGHANNIANNVYETRAFDRAVAAAIAWASNRTDTLILVTADHETGGLKVLADNGPGVMPTVTWGTTGHTATNVGIYAWGLEAQTVGGVMDNTEVYQVMLRAQGITPAARELSLSTTGTIHTVWDAQPGDTYSLNANTNLMTTNWVPIAVVTAATHVLNIADTNAATERQRFYRLRTQP